MFIVEESRDYKDFDGLPKERRSLYAYATEAEAHEHVAASDRPGFGQRYDAIRFRVYSAAPTLIRSHEQPPITLLEAALPLAEYNSSGCTGLGRGVKVDVGLRGKGWDPDAVFWDSRHNSFAIVKPPSLAPSRLVSDQGVLLLSINGIGEIRWDVYGGWCAASPENVEAVAHFGLTWK